MMTERIICNAKTKTVTREWVENDTPAWVDYEAEIEDCKQRLAQTDYIAIKIAEKVATRKDYADVIAERAALRERINELKKLSEKQMKGETAS